MQLPHVDLPLIIDPPNALRAVLAESGPAEVRSHGLVARSVRRRRTDRDHQLSAAAGLGGRGGNCRRIGNVRWCRRGCFARTCPESCRRRQRTARRSHSKPAWICPSCPRPRNNPIATSISSTSTPSSTPPCDALTNRCCCTAARSPGLDEAPWPRRSRSWNHHRDDERGRAFSREMSRLFRIITMGLSHGTAPAHHPRSVGRRRATRRAGTGHPCRESGFARRHDQRRDLLRRIVS